MHVSLHVFYFALVLRAVLRDADLMVYSALFYIYSSC